jgi:hypothetical protein
MHKGTLSGDGWMDNVGNAPTTTGEHSGCLLTRFVVGHVVGEVVGGVAGDVVGDVVGDAAGEVVGESVGDKQNSCETQSSRRPLRGWCLQLNRRRGRPCRR